MAAEFFIQAVAGQAGVLPSTGGEKVIAAPWGRGLRCLRKTLTHFTQSRRQPEERPNPRCTPQESEAVCQLRSINVHSEIQISFQFKLNKHNTLNTMEWFS